MNPIDYSIDVQTPFQSALQGYQVGAAIRNDQAQLEQQRAAAQAQQQQQALLYNLASNPNATADDYAAVMTQIPSMSEHLKRAWDTKNTAQQQASAADLLKLGAAIKSGRGDVAAKSLMDRAEAIERSNGGQVTPESQALKIQAQVINESPKLFLGQTIALLSANPNGKAAAEALAKFGEEQRAEEQAPADLAKKNAEAEILRIAAINAPAAAALSNANTRSQIDDRAGRLSLDKDKLTSDIELELYKLDQKNASLSDDARKIVNDATVTSVAADQSAEQMLDLASRLEKAGALSGAMAKGSELYKSLTGNQDAITQLRQEYVRLRSSQVSKMLPPGPASDKDIQLALSGFPSDTADASTMAAFVRGMAKLQQVDAAMNSAKAEWVNTVGHLGKPKSDIEVDGIKVPAGSTFVDFSRQFLQRRADSRAAEQAAKVVANRDYMRFANPGAK